MEVGSHMSVQLVRLLAAANEGGVWYGTTDQGMDLAGWLVVGAIVAVIAGLCWVANWAVKRSVSGEEAVSRNRDAIGRLVDGIMQTFRQ